MSPDLNPDTGLKSQRCHLPPVGLWASFSPSWVCVITSRTGRSWCPSWGVVQGTWEMLLKALPQQLWGPVPSCPPSASGAVSVAHPSPKPGELCPHPRACLLAGWDLQSAAGSFPCLGLHTRAQSLWDWSSRCLLLVGEIPGPSQLDDGSARVGFWALGRHLPEGKGHPGTAQAARWNTQTWASPLSG